MAIACQQSSLLMEAIDGLWAPALMKAKMIWGLEIAATPLIANKHRACWTTTREILKASIRKEILLGCVVLQGIAFPSWVGLYKDLGSS